MKMLVVIIMLCGQPDTIIVGKPGEAPRYNYADQMTRQEIRYLKKLSKDPSNEVWIVPDERNQCI